MTTQKNSKQNCAVSQSRPVSNSSCLDTYAITVIADSIGIQGKAKWETLAAYFGSSDETQWLAKMDPRIAKELTKKYFRPEMPVEWKYDETTWLTNINIEYVLRQYESNLKTPKRRFKFHGCFFSDSPKDVGNGQCVSPELCEFRDNAKSRDKRNAFIFNLDVHTGPGKHWTACFIGFDNKRPARYGVFYYDSVGNKMPRLIKNFANSICSDVNQRSFKIYQNARQKQRKNTECGIYALVFVILFVMTDIPFEKICTDVMKHDDFMNSMRSLLFRTPR